MPLAPHHEDGVAAGREPQHLVAGRQRERAEPGGLGPVLARAFAAGVGCAEHDAPGPHHLGAGGDFGFDVGAAGDGEPGGGLVAAQVRDGADGYGALGGGGEGRVPHVESAASQRPAEEGCGGADDLSARGVPEGGGDHGFTGQHRE